VTRAENTRRAAWTSDFGIAAQVARGYIGVVFSAPDSDGIWLECNHCRCGYSGIRRPGDRCSDLSWLQDESFRPFQQFIKTLREHQRLMCRGHVWPNEDYATGRRKRWSREQLFDEHTRLILSLPRYRAALSAVG